MLTIKTLSIPFYQFQCDPNLLEDVYVKVKNSNFKKEPNQIETSSTYFYDEKLINWFEECLSKIQLMYFNNNLKLEVVNCWATKTMPLNRHNIHDHQQAVVSGILYFDTCDTGETLFYIENPWQRYQNERIMNISETKQDKSKLVTTIKQEKGKLILYPPHIYHGTNVNKERNPRYTIAFDAFISGKITLNSQWPYVEIQSTNIHTINNNAN